MKLIWIGAFVLLVASVAALISNRQSGRLLEESWVSATKVLPDAKLNELQRTTPAYTGRIFGLFPEQFRQKLAAKAWKAVELMIFRSLVLWHLTPAFLMPLIVGFFEGSWARSNQKTLIEVHSPLRFSMSVTSLGLIPVLTLLWVAAPVALSAVLVVLAVGSLGVISTRNLIVHAPTQF